MWERDPVAMRSALSRHDEILNEVIERHGGHVFKTVGDAFCATFSTATDALEAALVAQRALHCEPWEEECKIRARMALHTGAIEQRGGDYLGPPVNRVARLLSAGHGGQVLLSLAVRRLAADRPPHGAELRDMGERRLKDLTHPEHVFQLTIPDLPADFPPLKTLDARRNNLPVQPTPLIGRERAVREICGRLRQREARLLTLTGPGGTGKTRLSLQAAVELLDEFRDGVFFVELAPIDDPSLVATTIARTLGLIETADQTTEEGLKEYVRSRQVLLVLDNFEQVLEAAPLVGGLLASGPDLRVLATSRAALGVYGETEYAVPPLELPDPGHLPSLDSLNRYEAVRLFVERAQGVKTGFALTHENAPAVAAICARLDGLPLAIELAASRARILTPQAMLKRLGDRLKLLTGGAGNLPARQQTLRGAIEWSHDLLAEEDRTLFRRMAVFAGGRMLEAMEAVCAPEGEPDVLDGVQSLVEKSLLRQEEGPEEEPRFVMLETIHEYARERLEESGEAEEISRAHAAYFLSLAEQAEPELRGPGQVGWLERLEAEHDNMRAALSWSLERGEVDITLRLVDALWWFWHVRGHWSEGTGWLERALSASGGGAPGSRARTLSALGWMASWQGDCERAEMLSAESLALHRELQDLPGIARDLSSMGWTAMLKGDTERASRLLEESLALSREVGDDHLMSRALQGLAWAACEKGDLVLSDSLLEESLVLSRKRRDTREVANSLSDLGLNSVYQGGYERAAALFEEALVLRREIGDRIGLAANLNALGMAALGRGDPEAAKSLIVESLTLGSVLGYDLLAAENLEVLAAVTGGRGEESRAARLWGAAEALRESLDVPVPPSERALRGSYAAAARSRLGEEAWEKAQAEGRAMTLEGAVAYALQEGTNA